ncbi:FRG domain-containing protein [Tamlana fucoidanivorans]|uniref:FRG domain-containing protein n=1 Tax=Allotamlana fucoidanivorans TaxID=2583814 RepID=A0A5C4SPM3_9FLAO|nr:FRG domain-containing protein [Tamlana fucoidanivorans]TNJ46090.1 FRG domain-containing protein [Tamlana fucoidanivorans]
MSQTYEVKNIAEALKLAKQFQRIEKYNLFRGQAQNWEVIPTAGRLSKKQFEKSIEQIERIFTFFNIDKTLKKYCTNVDYYFAIAQHYGIPTNYIDFTQSIDVAFYFATNSQSNKIGEYCSIICLNEYDFEDFIQIIKVLYDRENVVPSYISRVEVDNLWRLQAQKGCFLFTPYHQIEQYYPFDRIIFPYTESYNKIKKADIYPERKSELEIILDGFFDTEKRIEGLNRINNLAKQLKSPIISIPNNNQYEILEKKEVHKSWYSYTYQKWKHSFKEEWKSSKNEKQIQIHILQKFVNDEFIETIKANLTREFKNKRIDKKTPLIFDFSVKPILSKKNSRIISVNCRNIWDGTRNLPYSIEDILSILTTYLSLELQDIFTQDSEELILLEMANKYGSRVRFKTKKNNIISYFRNDLNDIILKKLPRPIPAELLLHLNKPRYVFDFKKLIEFFKTEAIANQVFYNRENKFPVIFYTPVQIDILGYA